MEEESSDGELGFEELGLEARILRAVSKLKLEKPTPIQLKAIPLILQGKDVVARAKTGSGKTLAYILPLLHKLLADDPSAGTSAGPRAVVLVPTRELCQQVHDVVAKLLEYCGRSLKVVQLTSSLSVASLRAALVGPPEIVVTTPACLASCLSNKTLLPACFVSLSVLVLDEADLLLSYGYEEDLKTLAPHIPRSCQCLLMSATSSEDVEKLKKLVLHNPVTLKLTEVDGQLDDSSLPNSVQQYKISCKLHDKLLYMLVLLKFGLIQKKALIFVNSIDTSFRLKLFLEQFGIKSAVLNAELPQNSRLHILKAFNVGLFDYLLATDDCRATGHHAEHNDEMAGLKEVDKSRSSSDNKGRRAHKDTEFGVVRGIDFKNVRTVVNYDMPPTISGYIHRVGRTGRAGNAGAAISLVSLEEEELLRSLEEFLSENVSTKNSTQLGPFPLLSDKAIESLRYRAEDVARGVTKIAVREARAKELRLEILNSDLLKTHFEDNPADLELLKHDKVLSKQQPASHLRTVPEYLRDPTTEAASMAVKAARAAMGQSTSRFYSNRKRRKPQSDDPLKAFSAGSKRWKGGKNDARGLPGTLWARKKGEKRGSSGESRGNSKSLNSSRKKLHRRRKR